VNEATKILLTACATITGGAILFCITTLVQRLIFEPVLAFRKTLGDVSYCLQYHAWVFHTSDPRVPPERLEKVFEELRAQTARLRADANAIPAYDTFARIGWIPRYPDLIEASGRLIRISNSLGRETWDQMNDDLKTVENLLRIDIGRPKYKREV
jgi:hypothetical protein